MKINNKDAQPNDNNTAQAEAQAPAPASPESDVDNDTLHEVEIDGVIVHSGPGWQDIFKQAMFNPEFGFITHLVNGKPNEQAGPTPGKRWQLTRAEWRAKRRAKNAQAR